MERRREGRRRVRKGKRERWRKGKKAGKGRRQKERENRDLQLHKLLLDPSMILMVCFSGKFWGQVFLGILT